MAAMQHLKSRDDIIIKPADKGGALVILNELDYVSEATRQLEDTTFYQRLDGDPTANFKSLITNSLTNLIEQQKIPASALNSLVPLSPVAGRFYLLPKIHKAGNPGRPIVSGIGTVTELISLFVDSVINPIPPSFPSYIKDTNHFLSDIVDLFVPPGSLLVTLDVASLYTNIPHADGIQAALHSYNESVCDKIIDSSTLVTLLKLILEFNNFEFNGVHYLQVNGTSMGTPIGPTYANIFMGLLENKFLASRALKPLYYKRFIDDIFIIWQHGEAHLSSFIHDFNNAHPSISFSHAYSEQTINFLDVTLTMCDGQLATTVYRKPIDRQQYLHFNSYHVKHCKTSIPYGQALRFKRICSQQSDFNSNCAHLRNALVRQKYPSQIIDDAIKRADSHDREALLGTKKKQSLSSHTNLVLTYSAPAQSVNAVLRKHHNILLQSERLKSIFREPPRVTYRRSRNLRDFLTSSKGKSTLTTGCRPCNKPRCKVCHHMTTSSPGIALLLILA